MAMSVIPPINSAFFPLSIGGQMFEIWTDADSWFASESEKDFVLEETSVRDVSFRKTSVIFFKIHSKKKISHGNIVSRSALKKFKNNKKKSYRQCIR